MSLYTVQKLLYELNRDTHTRERFDGDFDGLLGDFDLTDEEKAALRVPDVGLLYVMGVNGQILMHYAALRGFEWDQYIQAMRDGLEAHGPVRSGLYLTTGGKGAV